LRKEANIAMGDEPVYAVNSQPIGGVLFASSRMKTSRQDGSSGREILKLDLFGCVYFFWW
jgi:hypothetical protein